MTEYNKVLRIELKNSYPDHDDDDSKLLTSIGYALEHGTVFRQDYAASLEMYRTAAAMGNETAINNIGWLYLNGYGTEKDVDKAVEMFEESAEKGCRQAMLNLGIVHEFGYLGEPNYEEAAKWYYKSASRKNLKGWYNFARLVIDGKARPDCREEAVELACCLVEGDVEFAAFLAAKAYEEGIGCETDYDRARHYYRLGAISGDGWCYYRLAVMYEKGIGVKKDLHAAMDYYLEAARLGIVPAMIECGSFFEKGRAVKKDPDRALEWYKKAADNDDETGKAEYERLLKRMGNKDDGNSENQA